MFRNPAARERLVVWRNPYLVLTVGVGWAETAGPGRIHGQLCPHSRGDVHTTPFHIREGPLFVHRHFHTCGNRSSCADSIEQGMIHSGKWKSMKISMWWGGARNLKSVNIAIPNSSHIAIWLFTCIKILIWATKYCLPIARFRFSIILHRNQKKMVL